MRQILLAIIVTACFCSMASARLTRVYVIVNMDNAPVEILEFGKSSREDEDYISSVVEYKNRAGRDIEALAITMVYYDAFDEKQDGVRGISTYRLVAVGLENTGTWSIYGKPDFVKTAIAFVSAVRFWPDGEIWKANIDDIFRIAGDTPELSFLSETKMLGIEKIEKLKQPDIQPIE